jgi:hypothetical protein
VFYAGREEGTLGGRSPFLVFGTIGALTGFISRPCTPALQRDSSQYFLPCPTNSPPSTPQPQKQQNTGHPFLSSIGSGHFQHVNVSSWNLQVYFFPFALICIFNTLPQAGSHLVNAGAGVMMSHFRRTQTACCFLCFICWPTILIYGASLWFYLHMKCSEHFNLLAMSNDS